MDAAPDSSEHFCPISKEAGIAPRRSIDVTSSSTTFSAAAASKHVASMQQAVWHPSTQWAASPAAAPASPGASNKPSNTTGPQQQQLGDACRRRDAKLVQNLLPACSDSISEPCDAEGNTALHAALLPYAAAQQSEAAASVSWLTCCFGGGAAASAGSRPPCSSSSRTLSCAAAAAAQHNIVSALLAAGASTNVRNQHSHTPLMLAVLQLLSAGNSSSNSTNSSNILVAAALKTLELLCKHVFAEPNMKDAQGRTALALLLQQDEQQQAVYASFGDICMHSNSSASTHAAAAAGTAAGGNAALAAAQLKGVQLLLHCGADCNAADKAGLTPLMYAAAQPQVSKELLQLLLERGANTRQLDNSRRSALTHAVRAHNLKLLPAVGVTTATISSSNHQGCCPACGCEGGVAAVAGGVGKDPGASAAAAAGGGGGVGGNLRVVAATHLIKAAPDDIADSAAGGGGGAAHASSGSNSVGECDSCACSPADLHAQVSTCPSCGACQQSCSNGSASHVSASASASLLNPRHSVVIKALCSYGALDLHPSSINTRYPGLSGFSQLHIAMRRGDVVALQMLLAGGADVNATDMWGNSPLMYWPVTPRQPTELVEELVGKLLSFRANPNLPNLDGWMALDMACELNKLGKVVVKQPCTPVHALLVGWGAKNSTAFKDQHRNPPQLLCMRTDSANDFIRNSKGFGSIRVISTSELEQQVATVREDNSY